MESCCVSVIMPCYNDGKYIRESIASLMAQTYKDYELIVIDDGSDDAETLKILESLPAENIRLLHTDHLGPSGARNYGIRQSMGKYILPLDSDDLIDPSFLAKTVKILDENPNVGGVSTYAELFGAQSGRWQLPDYSFEEMLRDNCIFISTLFRREDFDAVGGFNETMDAGIEDYDFWLSILQLGREIRQIPEMLYHYRVKKKSRTTEFKRSCADMQRMYQIIFDTHRELYRDNFDIVIPALRNDLIEQTFIREKMEKGIRFIMAPFHKFTFLKKLLKKFL